MRKKLLLLLCLGCCWTLGPRAFASAESPRPIVAVSSLVPPVPFADTLPGRDHWLGSSSRAANASSRGGLLLHALSIAGEYGYVFPTNPFLAGDNARGRSINDYAALHLAYSFRFREGSLVDRVYGSAYQGMGFAWYTFGNRRELGNPAMFYLLQGARVARLAPRLSLDYEWNFGLSWGWVPYGPDNYYNIGVGSRLNAYLNAGLALAWRASSRVELRLGAMLSHFSNGNTSFPNAGVNILGARAGVAYAFTPSPADRLLPRGLVPAFPRHVSYDLVLFGSWRRKVYDNGYGHSTSPRAYAVLGAGLSAMYNPGYKLRVGAALDFVYDASANEFIIRDPSYPEGFAHPPLTAKMALGLSGRVEYVMPIFTVGIGLGGNVLHRGGDLKAFYQMLYLKMAATRSFFLHVGYRLQEFNTPNYLMLGFGFRLNNRYPRLSR